MNKLKTIFLACLMFLVVAMNEPICSADYLEGADIKRVNVASDGSQANGFTFGSSISADGRYIAFGSYATNLVPNDTNNIHDIFVHDRNTGRTTRVSIASDGSQANGYSGYPSISADGRYIAFISSATNLVLNDTNDKYDVFVHDREIGETTRVNISSDGSQANGSFSFGIFSVDISADGRYIAFGSSATNLVFNDTNGDHDIFVHDRNIGRTTRVSIASDGSQANGYSGYPSISADGRYVTFRSLARNLVSDDTIFVADIFIHDRNTGEITRASVNSDGDQANMCSDSPSISADGRYIAFLSWATNLVSDDTNNMQDVFVVRNQNGLEWPDISITSTSLKFFNEDPYLPNVLLIEAMVKNEGNVKVDGVITELFLDGGAVYMDASGSLEPGEERPVLMYWENDSNVENKILKVEATIVNGVDSDLSNNITTKPVSFYWIDFKHDEDAFKFPNWKLSVPSDYLLEYDNFLSAQIGEKDFITLAVSLFSPIIMPIGKGGHCYGMAASSLSYYLWPDTKQVNKTTFTMEENEAKGDIIERHWEQWTHIFSMLVRAGEIKSDYSVVEEYNQIVQSVKNKKEPQFLFLRKQSTGADHSVVAHKILDIGPDEKRVFIYENNRPYDDPSDGYNPDSKKVEDNYITFKPLSNEVSYILKGTEETLTFDRVAAADTLRFMGYEEIKAATIKNIKLMLEKLLGKNHMFLRTRSPVTTLITNESGERIGYKDGETFDEIENAIMEQQFESYLYYLPMNSTYTIEMTGTDTGVLGLDFVMPISEDEVRIALYENILVTLDSITTATINPENLFQEVVSETGEVIEPKNEGELNSNLALNAKWLKEKTKENLEEAKTGNNRTDKKINGVIRDINKSLQDNLWQDEAFLDSKKGRKVFGYEMAAVTKMKLYLYLSNHSNYHKLPDNVIVTFEEAVENLVAADKILAENILEKAKNTSVNNSRYQNRFDRMIAKAEQNLEQANQYLANKPARAIFRHGFSWYYSQKAIKIAEK